MNAKLGGGTDRARALALFAMVVEHGSFSAAGRALDMSPSAIGRAIDRIEARLGVRLLLRSTRALSLTAEGQAYLQAARRILADLDDAERQIADQGAPRGRLRISAALSHGRLCVVPLLGAFAVRYPHILTAHPDRHRAHRHAGGCGRRPGGCGDPLRPLVRQLADRPQAGREPANDRCLPRLSRCAGRSASARGPAPLQLPELQLPSRRADLAVPEGGLAISPCR